jgi:hypothetical protein
VLASRRAFHPDDRERKGKKGKERERKGTATTTTTTTANDKRLCGCSARGVRERKGTEGNCHNHDHDNGNYNGERQTQTPAACGGTPFEKGAVQPAEQNGGQATTTKTTNYTGKNIDQCRGGFQTLPCGHLRDNETADGQHETGRVIAGRNLKNAGGWFFAVFVVVVNDNGNHIINPPRGIGGREGLKPSPTLVTRLQLQLLFTNH